MVIALNKSITVMKTGICYRMVPDRSLARISDQNKAKGFKLMRDSDFTILCQSNWQSLGQTVFHRLVKVSSGFSSQKHAKLAFAYRSSKNARMTLDIFEEWFQKILVPFVKAHLRRQKLEPKALLLLGNCPAHPQQMFWKAEMTK